MMMFGHQPGTIFHVLGAWLALTFLISSTSAVDIGTRFRVEMGSGPILRSGKNGWGGSCYGLKTADGTADLDLNALYTGAIDMASYAVYTLNNYATMPTVRATVETFGIRLVSATGTTVDATQSALFAYVKCTSCVASRYALLPCG